jgi:amino acid transporter
MMPRPGMKNLIFLSTIFFAFGGCESASFMGEEIREPRRVIPRSLFVAGFILAVGYIAGTLSLLVALPAESINGLSGFMTAIDLLARHIGLLAMVAPIAVLVAISNIGAASRIFRRLRGCPSSPEYTVTCRPRSAVFIRASARRMWPSSRLALREFSSACSARQARASEALTTCWWRWR